MAKVMMLRHAEGIRFDPSFFASLYTRLGEKQAEEAIAASMTDLAALLADIRDFAQAEDDFGLSLSAGRLAVVAADIGLVTLSRVATDVSQCAAAGDAAARAATLSRLFRSVERSLAAIWSVANVSM